MKYFYIAMGFLCIGLGALGAVLPVLPTTPFLLLASYCFAKGSEKFSHWFESTKLYKRYLENYFKRGGMTRKGKLKIMIPVSLLLLFFIWRAEKTWMKIALLVIMLVKDWYFITKIKTLDAKPKRVVREVNETD